MHVWTKVNVFVIVNFRFEVSSSHQKKTVFDRKNIAGGGGEGEGGLQPLHELRPCYFFGLNCASVLKAMKLCSYSEAATGGVL